MKCNASGAVYDDTLRILRAGRYGVINGCCEFSILIHFVRVHNTFIIVPC